MKFLRIFLLLFGVTALSVGGWNLWRVSREYRAGDNAYSALESYVIPAAATVPTSGTAPAETETETRPVRYHPPVDFPSVDFAALREINPHTVGWIVCEDTPVNYPIVQAEDNEYYLTHLFNGQANSSGAIFLDCSNDSGFRDENSILYGHNMKNGAMFAALMNYKSQKYYDEHPRMLLITPEQNYVITLFSGAPVSGFGDSWQISFSDEMGFDAWLQQAVERSVFHSEVTPTAQDQIITLSTCTYEFSEARFVLMGILEPA